MAFSLFRTREASPEPEQMAPAEPEWPPFHEVLISHQEVWGFMCFYAQIIGERVIPKNLIPRRAMPEAERFNFWFCRYDYNKAYAELPSSGFKKPEKFMADLTNEEIYVLLRNQYKELGGQLDRYNGDCKPTLERMLELAKLVKPRTRDESGGG